MNKLSAAKPNSANRLYPLVLLLGGVCFAFSSFSVRAQAQDLKGSAEAGKAKVWLCTGCHSIPDYRADYPLVYHVPKIGGQNSAYISSALLAYKKGERKHPTMRAISTSLSDQDMADIGEYYAAQSSSSPINSMK
ncbi:cytochrome c [Polynucleobacter sp. IMCC30063]|uniref:c-type cytochrome n=1 Tax=unclassified Polynucleobacter TaxID=2640945 RepID=UPI001F436B2F|nr:MULTISPECIES: cytochrome c [unclassified Polynucleobacter]MCE7506927.1 cytochrome c [Polynucleobacter sp. IMCC30063]MCE7527444.1 cytochrome c [Polynucleobacter sp. IMCC 30228]MCE7528691.1 cytochrome c [Polynucleobacter sp. IMCC 29146]